MVGELTVRHPVQLIFTRQENRFPTCIAGRSFVEVERSQSTGGRPAIISMLRAQSLLNPLRNPKCIGDDGQRWIYRADRREKTRIDKI
jgi:hypothetical protein